MKLPSLLGFGVLRDMKDFGQQQKQLILRQGSLSYRAGRTPEPIDYLRLSVSQTSKLAKRRQNYMIHQKVCGP